MDALRLATGPLAAAEIAAAVMQAKEMPAGDAAFKEIVAARALPCSGVSLKRGTVIKHGTNRHSKWQRIIDNY